LVVLGAAGCGAKAIPDRKRHHVFRDAGASEDAPVSISDDFQPQAQEYASPVIPISSLFARRTQSALVFVDATTLKPVASVAGAYGSTCAANASSLYALSHKPCQVERFDGALFATTMLVPGGCTSGDGARMVAAGNSLYLSSWDTLAVFAIANDQLTEAGRIQLDDSTRDTFQLVGLADGRLLIPGGKKLHVYHGATALEPLHASAHLAHLASAGADRIWYSAYGEHGIDRVVLAKLEPGLPAIATLETRIVHLASAPDGAAVLTVDPTGWSIVVLDANGRERQRIKLPAEFTQFGLPSCFVALSAKIVVLDAGTDGLFGWDIATGARL